MKCSRTCTSSRLHSAAEHKCIYAVYPPQDSGLSYYSPFLTKHLEQWGGGIKASEDAQKWSSWCYLHQRHSHRPPESLYFEYCRAAVHDASHLNSAIIRSESAERTGEMRKHTHSVSHTHHREAVITFSSRRHSLSDEDIYHCPLFGARQPGWVWPSPHMPSFNVTCAHTIITCIRTLTSK